MASVKLITELYKDTLKDITTDTESWQQFLKTASMNYKRPFNDQVLIYGQKQEAVGCISIESWNTNFKRWVKKGSKGIALLTEKNGYSSLEYVFDVNDTQNGYGKNVHIWSVGKHYEEDIIESLENNYGELTEKGNIGQAIISATSNAVQDNIQDYLSDFDLIDKDMLENILTYSISYITINRCGLDPNSYIDSSRFDDIVYFEDIDDITSLGLVTNDIAKMELNGISKTIKNLRIMEIDKIRTFDKNTNLEYYENERGDLNENNLHNAGRLLDSEYRNSNQSSDSTRQVQYNEIGLSQEEQEKIVHEIIDGRQVNGTLERDSIISRDESTRDNEEIDDTRESGRELESNRPNEMGRTYEQLQDDSRGNSESRTNNGIRTLYNEKEDKSNLPFLIDERVNDILLTTPHLKATKREILEFYNNNLDEKERTEYIKGIFNDDYTEVMVDDKRYGYKTYQNVLHLWSGSYLSRDSERYSNWKTISHHFEAMILLNTFDDRTKPLPSENQQLTLLEQIEKQNNLEFPQEMIDYYLTSGSGFVEGKYRVYRQFQESLSTKENIQFLKNEYGIGGTTSILSGSGIGVDYDYKGIRLYKGYEDNRPELLLSWNQVEKRLKELIKIDRYLNPKEKEQYPVWLDKQEQIVQEDNAFEQSVTIENEEEYTYEYHLGDKVYIGVEEYEILSYDDKEVRLYDYQFPLFNKEMPREEFDKRVKENPANEHLKVKSIPTEENTYYGEYNDEVDLINHILNVHKIYDIEVSFDDNEIIVAKDDDNTWKGKELYDFLYNDLFVYNDDGKVDLIDDNDFQILNEYRKKYGTPKEIENDYSDIEEYENYLGEIFSIDGREYEVEEIDSTNDEIKLKDLTYQKSVGYPINRVDRFSNIKQYLNQEKEIVPQFQKPISNKVRYFDLHPEVKNIDRYNYQIEDNYIGVGTPKERFRNNINSIKILKLCKKEDRFATPEEQKILINYVGWGGLSEAFDESNLSWANEYKELKELLTEEEYRSAIESTLTAFYTPPVVVRSMYKALEKLGLKQGNVLEPSCGIGNFFGLMPNSLEDCKLYGVELDSISGQIAQQLYQKSSIAVQGFEQTNLPDSFFDASIGNVPFGDFKLNDKKYDKNNFLIHDYFFAKTLDKIRPGGIVAFITSKGTLDKETPTVRKYLAQRAELLGAIRLPDTTFKSSAGTEVTADIIFLQKRDSIVDIEPDWVHLDTNENGIKMNSYFVEHPEMIMGNMVMQTTRFGMDSACKLEDINDLGNMLNNAISNINGTITEYQIDDIDEEDLSIEADIRVKNFSYTIVDDKIYFRENSRMYSQDLPLTTSNRVKGLIEIRDTVKTIIDMQLEDYPDADIKYQQSKLNTLYDSFNKKYGLINSRANSTAFSNDSSYYLLCSLELLDENNELSRKADMFTKRTIRPKNKITEVDTANDALIVSISEKACVDISFMQSLCKMDMDKMLADLEGTIFNVPYYGDPNIWVTADEYLSGNIREKLKIAEEFALENERFNINVKYLKEVMPKELSASEISIRLGATWLPTDIVNDFIYYIFETNWRTSQYIKAHYSELTSEWNIENKNYDRGNVRAYSTYGTSRANGYRIIEDTLNLKDVRIYDYNVTDDGKREAILNKKETAIAQAKQEQIKLVFDDWIWSDPERRERLVNLYNEKFNSIRNREYDGSHITFDGINPEITLREHQVNAIARILYGGNTLLAHEVGAGKTFEMVAAAMESKRLGLCNKSLFVVPNHIIEQFASEFLQLYPSANILVSTKKDFETANRKKFCSRIATGDYDAIIIGHSQFERIPMSTKRQIRILENQIDDITRGIKDLKANGGEKYSIKAMMKSQKAIETKLAKLNDSSKKDDVVTFEELGVDRIFVDEAHYYKNLYLYTKMRNVGGIAQTEAQKSSDLFMKCRYLDELTGNKGVVFATGTPISNSMVELYTMQRYLQYDYLLEKNLQHFDAWASTFGETITAIELSPEGTGYRAKTRFAKFYNLPELMSMFKEVADIKTADTLNLPVPKANYENVVIKPSEMQLEIVKSLAERAEKIRNKEVESHEDNMLKITNDGRKLALDQRLINDMLPDEENSKVAVCANNVFRIWEENKDKKLTQLLFCDLSTPNEDKFNVYDNIKKKLIEKGIPEEEIEFIHNANTELRKKEVFSKVRKGQIRFLMGSTFKMGSGTNCQDKLIALHDLDCPWRPSDLIQRSGRIIRQGNQNPEVYIYRYVTEKTFDAYLYQLVENKQRFISQIMSSKTPVRSAEDIDETALSYAEIKALAAGNPLIIEKTELDTQVAKLKLLKQSHLSQIYEMEDKVIKHYPSEIKRLEVKIENVEEDIKHLRKNTTLEVFNPMTINEVKYTEKADAGKKLLEVCKSMTKPDLTPIGNYRGFKMELSFDTTTRVFQLTLKNKSSYNVELGGDIHGNITRIDNTLSTLLNILSSTQSQLENQKIQYENAKKEINRPFPQEDELKEKTKRLNELNVLLNLNKKENEIVDSRDEVEDSQTYKKDFER
ncbi:MAG: SNF2-related protein [Bacteroidales bacterium]|nr:SNF2-related protein [Bacteroidales bacterium]